MLARSEGLLPSLRLNRTLRIARPAKPAQVGICWPTAWGMELSRGTHHAS